MGIGQGIIRDLIKKFPNAGNLTIARMAYKEHPRIWSRLEAARSQVRNVRGANGDRMRCKLSDKSMIRPKGNPFIDPFATFPNGMTQLEDWKPLEITGENSVLIFGDTHIPYHDRAATLTTIKHGKDRGADLILLNGDIADCFAVSFWEKNPEQRNFGNEIKIMREFLCALRSEFKKARIIYKLGNHEERFIRYMRVKAPELIGVDLFSFAQIMELDKYGIELVQDKVPIRLGDLNVLHGHEYRFAISNPVNPARGLFLRSKAYAVCNHFHQPSHHSERNIEQNTLATWSLGCLCDLHPEYAPINNWSHGFAMVEVESGGKFHVQNKVIKNGTIY